MAKKYPEKFGKDQAIEASRPIEKKPASYLHRTAQPHTLAIFRSWGSSAGAGRIRLAGCKYKVRKINSIRKPTNKTDFFFSF